MPSVIVLVCQIAHPAHSEDLKLGLMIATQQYVFDGLRPVNRAYPFKPVFLVKKGLPGRGLPGFRGVDSSTGIRGAGVPPIVTSTVALVIEGSGLGETGVDDGVGVVDPLWQAAMASAAIARTRRRRLGMSAWGSTQPGGHPFQLTVQR